MPKYLFKRKGSQHFWLRLQYNWPLNVVMGKRKVERSLGTPDRYEAEILAAPDIALHKIHLLIAKRIMRDSRTGDTIKDPEGKFDSFVLPTAEDIARSGVELDRSFQFAAGKVHFDHDGSQIIAMGEKITRVLNDGTTRIEDNPVVGTLKVETEEGLDDFLVRREISHVNAAIARTKKARPNPDDGIIDYWVKQKGIGKHLENEARDVWRVYRKLVDKPLVHATRDDGIKIAQHFLDAGNKSKTVDKKIGMVRAAINLSIKHGRVKLGMNPFSDVVPEMDDGEDRLPFSEADMAMLRARLHVLSAHDQLLFIWLATTGMRLSEAVNVREEHEWNGIRYIIVGTKTDTSRRRVPLSDAVIPLLPKRIEGPLFPKSAETHGKRLRYWIRGTGIEDRRKVPHSLRHRAADRLREARCPTVIRYQLLGHEIKTVADGYGEGEPISVLKEWIEKIGY